MENNLKFNSAICTDRFQSERLLALGLKKETADCYYFYCDIVKEWKSTILSNTQVFKDYPTTVIPAWSLGRLLEICGEDRLPISFHKKGKVKIRVNHIHPTHDGRSSYNYYDSIIDCIEWLIKEGYFNKEYLV